MRAFIAMPLASTLRQELVRLKDISLKNGRWVPLSQLHVTLHFLGDVPDSMIDVLADALNSVRAPRIEVPMKGIVQFPNDQRPRVMALEFTGSPGLEALYWNVASVLEQLSSVITERHYRPHLTIARLKHAQPVGVLDQVEKAIQPLRQSHMFFDRFVLFQSRLSEHGAVHLPIREYAAL